MFTNNLKIAWRTFLRNRSSSFINIGGLAAGMSVALLIGLWIYDEMTFDKYHKTYDRVAQIMQHQTFEGETYTQQTIPMPLGAELKNRYGNYFSKIAMSSQNRRHIIAAGDNRFVKTGNYMQAEAPSILSLNILKGSGNSLTDPYSILLSNSVAKSIFGNEDPVNKIVRYDDTANLKVVGVYEDLPANTTLSNLEFIVPWELQSRSTLDNIQNWGNNGWMIYVQMADNADVNDVSAKIKNSKYDRAPEVDQKFKPVIFLQPMSRWHLYSEFKNGVNVGGRIKYVRLFSAIGICVLLLACINFMNLATAKSEKRAKEVGIRKAIGSLRKQLVYQFYSESFLLAFMSFALSLIALVALLPFFNEVSGKQLTLPLKNPIFWISGLGVTSIVGLIAGSYPAFYLSSFQPVKVLKGTYRAGRLAAAPRKALVVLQFTASITLIICTIVVFKQIQFSKNRPVGYNREGLITVESITPDIYSHFDAFRADLMKTGAVTNVAWSSTPVTESNNSQSNFDWAGRDKNGTQNFATVGVSKDYGQTIGWQFVKGRDYRTPTGGADGFTFVVNESAAKLLGFKETVGQTVHWFGYDFRIIGVIKDMVMQSPYSPVQPTIFYLVPWKVNILNIKMKAGINVNTAIQKIGQVYAQHNPGQPFEYKFVDEEYAKKFAMEERVGKLAGFFAILAIVISCLGIFGMATFVAEQRIKEIGLRKVLGASVFNLWRLLSKDFVLLVLISLIIASPLSFYFMQEWLQNFTYKSGISWWIFVAAGIGSLLITVLTVSFQAIRAATTSPVKSLRTE